MRVPFIGVLTGLAILAAPAAHAETLTGFEEFTPGQQAIFQAPGFSGSTSANLVAGSASAVTSDMAFTGVNSYNMQLDWVDNAPTRWARVTTFNTPNLGNPVIDFTQALTMKVFIASEDAVGFTLGVRETNSAGDIGSNGGATGGIEFIGSTSGAPPTPTADRVLSPGAWHDLSFILPSEPVFAFAGATANGILESTTGKGTLEHLGIRSMGTGTKINLYIDDVRVVPANAIPEPGTMALLAGGLLPLLGLRRRK